MIHVNVNPQYYINARALTFSENDLGDPQRVAVSLVSGTVIMVYEKGTIDYAADGSYEKWTLRGYSTKFPDGRNDKHYIYARLSRTDKTALIVFSINNYNLDGSITTVTGQDENGNDITETSDPNENYFFVKIGELTATDGTSLRELTYDSGLLSTARGESITGVNEMWELDKYSTPWLINAKQWLRGWMSGLSGGLIVKGFVKLIGGLAFSKGKSGDEKLVTDVKRSTDSDSEFLMNPDGTTQTDEAGNPVENPNYVPVSDETIPTTAWVKAQSDDRYLKKYEPDETEHRIKFFDGIECGKYVEGDLTVFGGDGTKFDGNGYGVMNGLTLREFLEVPELRFNRIDVVSGILWNSIAFGIIETVDETEQICTLKLEKGERSGLKVGDLCMGIFSDFGTGTVEPVYDENGNVVDPGDDENGLPKLYGFTTSYFTPRKILKNGEGAFIFAYALQSDETPHPKPSMKFAVYGNSYPLENPDRLASAYSTRTYKRYLRGVDTWKINPEKHIVSQFGKLDGLVIGGMEMKGYGSFQDNIYITNSLIQFTKQQKEELKGEDAYTVSLSDYVGTIRVDERGNIIAGEYSELNVTSGDENVVTGEENVITSDVLLRTRIQAFRGTKELTCLDSGSESVSTLEGVYMASISPVGCIAELDGGIISVTKVTNLEYSSILVSVNCEGNATFEKTYQIKIASDGTSAFECSVFTRATEQPDTPTGGSYDSPLPTDVDASGVLIWSDGVPEGDLRLWMSRRTYSTDGEWPQTDWSEPRAMTDTADFEAVYHDKVEDDGEPALPAKDPDGEEWETDANGWYDNPTVDSFWMATNIRKNGIWQGWKVVRIKGEKGDSPLVLIASAKTISRSSFGVYIPDKITVRAVRGDDVEVTNMALFGMKDGQAKSLNVQNGIGIWELKLTEFSVADYDSMVFRCYAEPKDSYDFDTDPFIYSETVCFIGNGHSGPMPRNRGRWTEDTVYFYNEDYRDFVWTTDGMVYMRDSYGNTGENETYTDIDGVARPGGYLSKKEPENDTTYWKQTGRETLMAIDTALVENANIAGFMFKGGMMVSQEQGAEATKNNPTGANIILDGTTGYFKCVDADVDGNITAGSLAYKVLYADPGEDTTTEYDLTGYGMAIGFGTFVLPDVSNMYSLEIKMLFENWSRLARECVLKSKNEEVPIRIINNRGYSEDKDTYLLPNDNVLYTVSLMYNSLNGSKYWMVSSGLGGSEGGGVSLYVDDELSDSSVYPVQNKVIYQKFQSLGPFDYDSDDGSWTFNGDLLVTGGVTAYGRESDFEPSTIMDGVVADGTSILNDGGVLKLHPDVLEGVGGSAICTLSWSGYSSGSYDGSESKTIYIPSNVSQLNNDSGFITGIDYSMVTKALGYTPYSSDNPNGYVTSAALGDYLLKSGGTITGDIRLRSSDTNYGNTLYFGDSSYAYIKEDTDDHLKIYGSNGISLQTNSSYSVEIGGKGLTLNGGEITYDSTNKYFKLDGNLVVTGSVSLYSDGGAGNQWIISEAESLENVTVSDPYKVYSSETTRLIVDELLKAKNKLTSIKNALSSISSSSSLSSIGSALQTIYKNLE